MLWDGTIRWSKRGVELKRQSVQSQSAAVQVKDAAHPVVDRPYSTRVTTQAEHRPTVRKQVLSSRGVPKIGVLK
jgi:hypothetical protein